MAGWASLIPLIVQTAAPMFNAASRSSAQNRGARTAAELDRAEQERRADADFENAQQNRAELEMKQKAADAKARQDAFRSSMLTDAFQNWQPANRPSGVPSISFVRAPGAGGSAALDEMERQSLLRLMQGEQFSSLPALERSRVPELPKSSGWEKLMGILGPSLTAYGAIAPHLSRGVGTADDEELSIDRWTPASATSRFMPKLGGQ